MRSSRARLHVLIAALALFAMLLTRATAAHAASDAQKEALAKQLEQIIESLGALTGKEACAKLNPPFFTAREYLRQGEHGALRAAFQKALSVRAEKGCLIRCPKDRPRCGDDPKYAWQWHKALKDEIDTCRQAPPQSQPAPECLDIDGLEKAFRLNFLMLIRILPVGDQQLQAALDDVMITVDPGSAMSEVLRAVAMGKYSSDQLASVVKQGLASPKAHEFLGHLTHEVTALFSGPQSVAVKQDDLLALIISAIRLVQNGVSGSNAKKLAEAIETLTNNEEISRLLAAHELIKGSQGDVIFMSLQLLAKQNDEFLKQLTQAQLAALKAKKLPTKEVLVGMVHAVNHAQMAELRRLTIEVTRGRYLDPQFRRYRLATVTRLPASCNAAPADPQCTVAREFNEAVLSVVLWGALIGMNTTRVKADKEETLTLVEEVLRGRKAKADCDENKFGELCTEMPYAGVLILDFTRVAETQPAKVRATASFRLRGVDTSLRVGDNVLHQAAVGTAEEAQLEGGNFGRALLRQTGLSTPTNWFAAATCPECEARRSGPSWRQWAALGSIFAGGASAITGVYVSNTHPESSAGDRLWQGGLVLLGTGAAFQIWELLHD